VAFLFIHLGDDVMIPSEEIIAIFERSFLKNKKNIPFVENHERSYCVVDIGLDFTKSVVVCDDDTIYLSPFSALTLRRRLETNTPG